MGFFNRALEAAMESGRYICSRCGALMEFEDEWANTLICPECGHSVDFDLYGSEDEEDYDSLYPMREEILGTEDDDEYDEDDCGETYDEVCGELDDD